MVVDAGLVQADDPAQTGTATQNTLDNLPANVDSELTSQTGQSAGSPEITAPSDPNAAPDSPAEDTQTPAEAEGKFQRTSRENANLRQTLRNLNIEPDSDALDQFNSGLLTKEQLLGYGGPPAAPAQIPHAPISNLETAITAMETVSSGSGEVDADTFRDTMKQVATGFRAVVQENTDLKERDQRSQEAQRSTATVNAIFESELKPHLPEHVQALGQSLFASAVEKRVYEIAADNPDVPTSKTLGHTGHNHAARELAPQFAQFVNALTGNVTPAPPVSPPTPAGVPANTDQVRPLSPGPGGGSPPPPAAKGQYSIENLTSNVETYMNNQALRIGAVQ